jgi:hypothetical protein
MALIHKNVLLVEGVQEVRVIPELIEANGIDWGTKKNPIVYIRDNVGYSNLSDPDLIATELQESGRSALGIVLDADEKPDDRWYSIRNACHKSVPDLPADLPENGLICDAPNGIKFGIWMMPDNKQSGMLETFLAYMIPNETEILWQFAQSSVEEAKTQGAKFTEFQIDKANIYTWLAWQNPPGRQLHQAVMEKILDPKHPRAQKFVTWFKELYGL